MATHYIQKFASAAEFAAQSPEYSNALPIGSIIDADGHANLSLIKTLGDGTYGSASHFDLIFIQGDITANVTAANGLNMIRGEVVLDATKTLTGTSYVTGVYGRANIHGTVDIGSGDLAAVYGKMDFSSATLTSGHLAPVQSNIVNVPAVATALDLFYGESAHGNHINSCFKAFAAANFAFDLSEVSPGTFVTAAAGSSASKYLRLNLNGTAYKIALLADS